MIDRPTAPLEIARRVLRIETLREVREGGFSNSAYLILDRWALNSPDELQRLEQKGTHFLLSELEIRMNLEARTLNSDTAWGMRQQGMSDWEILDQLGVDTALKTTE